MTCKLLNLVLSTALCLSVLGATSLADTIDIEIAAILDDLEESLEDGMIDIASSDLELATLLATPS